MVVRAGRCFGPGGGSRGGRAGAMALTAVLLSFGLYFLRNFAQILGENGDIPVALAAWALLMIPFSQDPGWSAAYYKRFYLFTAIWVVAAVAGTERNRLLLTWFLFAGAAVVSVAGVVHALRTTGGLFDFRMGQISNPMTSGAMLMMATPIPANRVSRNLKCNPARALFRSNRARCFNICPSIDPIARTSRS